MLDIEEDVKGSFFFFCKSGSSCLLLWLCIKVKIKDVDCWQRHRVTAGVTRCFASVCVRQAQAVAGIFQWLVQLMQKIEAADKETAAFKTFPLITAQMIQICHHCSCTQSRRESCSRSQLSQNESRVAAWTSHQLQIMALSEINPFMHAFSNYRQKNASSRLINVHNCYALSVAARTLFSIHKLKGLEGTSDIIRSQYVMGYRDMAQFVRAAAAKWLLTPLCACTPRPRKLNPLRRGKNTPMSLHISTQVIRLALK